ncbi:MAG: hypothetical protein IK990_10685 [Ruminiclostridium sp.]|nr:hypothetical protein [Ruminiclostridium sp.]
MQKGQHLGLVTTETGGEAIGNAKITAAESAPRPDFGRCIDYLLKAFAAV